MCAFSRKILSRLCADFSSSCNIFKVISFNWSRNYGSLKRQEFCNFVRNKQCLNRSALVKFNLILLGSAEAGKFKKGLPSYTIAEVAKHKTEKTRVWVYYKQGVYDITDYIDEHPGGPEIIMQAAGGSLEHYFSLYHHHLNEDIFEILESLRIGNLKT
ncbi:unnamed protein product [Phyllotreta striolata]|uniref:Cytochrome b5 heme-binding domain-containing protein n=1 Tax=Phyllotreta striolata TaxID=444603 RepID=A0A9N9TVE2_PHYSR|nr:unnamed protein product [Phyllotreta striolata]